MTLWSWLQMYFSDERVGIVNRGIAIRYCNVCHQFVLGSSVLM